MLQLRRLSPRRRGVAWTGPGCWPVTRALLSGCRGGEPCRAGWTGRARRVAALVDELLASVAEPLEVVRARQAEELAFLQEEAERRGEKTIAGRSVIEERHSRELRRVRTDEIRAGLAVLSKVCRERLAEPEVSTQRLRSALAAIAAIDEASTRLSRNVNATMLLQWLLLHLDT